MRKLVTVAVASTALLVLHHPALGQDTNICWPVPATRLEAFETNTDTVVIKATAPIGSVTGRSGTVAVRCREITDAGTGRRESGIIVDVAFGDQIVDSLMVDYDELDTLLDGLEYLGKVDWTVTSLPSFDAVFTTKGGFRAAAFGSRRTGNIEFAVRSARLPPRPLVLSRDQMGQLRSLVEQAKAKLDALRREK